MSAKEKKLSKKHKLFADKYIILMNGVKAYQAVYPRASYESAMVNASKLLRNAKVNTYIEERLKETQMGAAEVLARLSDQARGSHRPFVKVDDEGFVYFDFSQPGAMDNLHLVKKIETKRTRRVVGRGENAEDWEDEWVRVELHDPQHALELLGKFHKLFYDREDKPNFSFQIDYSKLTAEQIKAIGNARTIEEVQKIISAGTDSDSG